jgi:hypothetical protein
MTTAYCLRILVTGKEFEGKKPEGRGRRTEVFFIPYSLFLIPYSCIPVFLYSNIQSFYHSRIPALIFGSFYGFAFSVTGFAASRKGIVFINLREID